MSILKVNYSIVPGTYLFSNFLARKPNTLNKTVENEKGSFWKKGFWKKPFNTQAFLKWCLCNENSKR